MTPDTNVLVRAFIMDDPAQTEASRSLLRQAEVVHISPVALSEFVWVLRQVYKKTRSELAQAVVRLLIADARG